MAGHAGIPRKFGDKRFNFITRLEHLEARSVTQIRDKGNMRSCVPLTCLTVSPPQADNFLTSRPRIPPVDYDSPTRHIILYPQPSQVQFQLIRILEKWLDNGAQILSTSSKRYCTRQSSQWKLFGRWQGCNYFARLILQQVGAFPSIVFETIHSVRGDEHKGHFERDYIYEKAARWFEGSNRAVRLVIIAIISHDPVLPWASPVLHGLNPSSPCHDWGISPNEIDRSAISTIATNITVQDKQSTARTVVDIYVAGASYPKHRCYAEHAWHGVFSADGQEQPADENSVASNLALSQFFTDITSPSQRNALAELPLPVHEFRTTLPRAVANDRYAQAEIVARDAQNEVRKWMAQGSPTN
ncbi:uncharacterized protein BHQ10_004211 [Talaromyces amestolkiae]|uniref:Uncharacterized protein n=1 Tax=Talaromyces amestolkiae TaxID=1196081 RepID=A0A364KXE0_TALAM|nr:uncharacterized protein BHQ10_004211 [Talaromyces amestolkiae]RAO68199.1 hypothetical protein BHQ10_004211 [Talaromyces amestolkiae]